MTNVDRRLSKKHATMAEPGLPMDMLIEVLILLPVKSILKFKCVSKTWRDLISSPVFIDRHMKCERKQSVMLAKRYLLSENGEYVDQILCFHDQDLLELLASPNLSLTHIPSCNCSFIQIQGGPSNGLFCIALGYTVFLCNPALREITRLPPLKKFPGGQLLGYVFGFDQIGGVYKVVQIREQLRLDSLDLLYDDSEPNGMDEIQIDPADSWKKIDAKVLRDHATSSRNLRFVDSKELSSVQWFTS